MKKFILLSVCIFLSLTSCSEAPSEVINEIENYKNAEIVQDAEIEKVSFSDAIEQAYTFSENSNTNITVNEIIAPKSTKLPTYRVDISQNKGYDMFTKMCSEPLFGNNGKGKIVDYKDEIETWKNKTDYCFTAFPTVGGKCYYNDPNAVKITDWGVYYNQDMSATNTGNLSMFLSSDSDISFYSDYDTVERVYANFNDKKKKYKLHDGTEKSVADMTQFAQDFCNEKVRIADNDQFNYRVNYLDVRELGDGTYGFFISLCREDKYGNLFDATMMYDFTDTAFSDRQPVVASPIHMWITSSDKIKEFEKILSFGIEEISDNKEIVTLKIAADILSKELAQGRSYHFDTVELKYVSVVTESDYIDDARKFHLENEDSPTFWSVESVYSYGNYEINAVPYWVFTNYTASGKKTNSGEIYMVNALDGSLRIENIDDSGKIILDY